MGAPEVLSVVFVLCIFVLPIVVVVWVAKASGRYQRNVRLSALLTGSRQLEPVGVGLRLLAFIIDLVVLGIAIGSIAAAIDAAAGHQSEAAAAIVALAGWFGYFGGMETIWGATLGRGWLRLRVVEVVGQRPGLWASLGGPVSASCSGAFSLVGIVVDVIYVAGGPAGCEVQQSPRRNNSGAPAEVGLAERRGHRVGTSPQTCRRLLLHPQVR